MWIYLMDKYELCSRGGNGSGYHCFFSDPDPHVTIKPDPDLIIRISIFKNILAIPIFQTRSVYFSENFGVVTDFSDQRASVTD